MSGPLRVLSLYEGFFAGGARILHTDVITGLQSRGQEHAVLSLASVARREGTVQRMEDDLRYARLVHAGVPVTTLGRVAGSAPLSRGGYAEAELQVAAEAVARADVVLSLKEQPIGLLLALRDAGLMPDIPVAVCLHRSDPAHSGPALPELVAAAATGLVNATISCAEATSSAYAAAGVRAPVSVVIPNGIDTDRFRPGSDDERHAVKAELGIPAPAPVVMLAARFDAMKNPGLFLASVAEHARHDAATHYVVCGAGMTWDNAGFRALAYAAGVDAVADDGRLHPLGIRDDMPRLYRVADIVALTSSFGEASPLCLIEGIASGATPVTTDVGDAASIVSGVGVVTAADPRQIASAWTAVLAGRDHARRVALSARPSLERGRMIDDYWSTLQALVAPQRAAA